MDIIMIYMPYVLAWRIPGWKVIKLKKKYFDPCQLPIWGAGYL